MSAAKDCDKGVDERREIALQSPQDFRRRIRGEGKNQVEVVGEGIDAVELTRRLRKNVAYAELVSVGEVKKEPAPAAKVETPTPQPAVVWTYAPQYEGYPQYPVYEVRGPSSDPLCTIM
ncbi:UNVERIFIED_CONTAM: hypothetical protein Sradi_2304700 [Sesamum radiatum]|uniref:Heavy metal transport/detoxification superfamily protein n=1 Tax=Sesamum radiatum TaxID=300843 RepID=A0AAW2T4F2_SESRA